jgi:hypothetical protein
MKMKSIAIAGAICAGSMSLALAQPQYVYMTGSTAFRAATFATLSAPGAVFDNAPLYVGYNGSSASGANFMIFSNTITIAGIPTPIIVKCHWSGSEAGVADVSGSVNESFLDDSVIPGGSQLGTTPTGSSLTTNTVDLAMADNALAFSKNPGSSASQTFCGIIPFVFVKGSNSLAAVTNVTNVTDQQLRKTLLVTGQKLALFTGVAADTNNYVYISGRDSFSGTRVNAYGITGFGIKSAPKQIELDATTGNMVDTGAPFHYVGDIGFSSGGTLVQTLTNNTAASVDHVNVGKTGFLVIAYAGISDANSVTNKSVVKLSYNGVAESSAAIEEGQYGFWGNEYVLQSSGASSQAQTVYTKLADPTTGIAGNCDGTIAISPNAMNATRGGPTTDPTHK